jgi:hypothetical protein
MAHPLETLMRRSAAESGAVDLGDAQRPLAQR